MCSTYLAMAGEAVSPSESISIKFISPIRSACSPPRQTDPSERHGRAGWSVGLVSPSSSVHRRRDVTASPPLAFQFGLDKSPLQRGGVCKREGTY
jgi:hypothetical protein